METIAIRACTSSLSTLMKSAELSQFQAPRVAKYPWGHGRVVPNSKRSIEACRSRMDSNQDYGGSRMVDEDMIVLRLRLKDMEKMERGEESVPSNWMEWEKKYYSLHFHGDVYAMVGFLQMFFMNSRPSLALGIIAVVASSVFFSTGVLLLHSPDLAKALMYFLTFSLH